MSELRFFLDDSDPQCIAYFRDGHIPPLKAKISMNIKGVGDVPMQVTSVHYTYVPSDNGSGSSIATIYVKDLRK